ncbi:hypothetical protein E2C01_102669 [Portunus trituberculatus]|uniref:Uncharacterized protein n=1 Tax=Portunus trituberculatus TaxID=210409 RepID=A0A5B7KJ30_PORTR|nr:hypothetical protein [Portunus trituberculatus]
MKVRQARAGQSEGLVYGYQGRGLGGGERRVWVAMRADGSRGPGYLRGHESEVPDDHPLTQGATSPGRDRAALETRQINATFGECKHITN